MMVGVLLAAGASTRMGSPKPLLKTRGMSFIAQGVIRLWTVCDQVVVVLGSGAARVRRDTEAEFAGLVESGALQQSLALAHRHGADGLELHFVDNEGWKSGMYGSVRIGLHEAMAARPEAVLVAPVDHPSVHARTVIELASVMRAALAACKTPKERKSLAYALVPRHRRRRGHPVALSPALCATIAADAAAEDLSDAIRRNTRLLGYLDVTDVGVTRNVNRPGD